MKSALVQIGKLYWIRLLVLLGFMIFLSMALRLLVVKFIPMSPLYLLAYDGAYFVAMVTTVVANNFWVELVWAEKGSCRKVD